MTDNEQKQQLRVAYVHAVAARAGYACQVTLVDDDSVDLIIAAKGRVHAASTILSPRLEVQLKASSQDLLRNDRIVFPLPLKDYEELRSTTMTPRALIVLLLPGDPDQWLKQSDEQMTTKRCAYWISLAGAPQSKNKKNVTVHLARKNRFDVGNLRRMMEAAARREPL